MDDKEIREGDNDGEGDPGSGAGSAKGDDGGDLAVAIAGDSALVMTGISKATASAAERLAKALQPFPQGARVAVLFSLASVLLSKMRDEDQVEYLQAIRAGFEDSRLQHAVSALSGIPNA